MSIGRINRNLAAAVVVMVLGNLAAAGFARAGGAVKVKGNHPAEVASLHAAVRAERSKPLDLTIVLGLHDQLELELLLAQQQDPSSKNYHRWLTPAQFADRFGPTHTQIAAVAQWLK